MSELVDWDVNTLTSKLGPLNLEGEASSRIATTETWSHGNFYFAGAFPRHGDVVALHVLYTDGMKLSAKDSGGLLKPVRVALYMGIGEVLCSMQVYPEMEAPAILGVVTAREVHDLLLFILRDRPLLIGFGLKCSLRSLGFRQEELNGTVDLSDGIEEVVPGRTVDYSQLMSAMARMYGYGDALAGRIGMALFNDLALHWWRDAKGGDRATIGRKEVAVVKACLLAEEEMEAE